MLEAYLDKLDLTQACVLDVGCGTGVAARAIARRRGFAGSTTGVDHSPALIEVAHRLAAAEGLDDRTTFDVADGQALPYVDESFDVVIAHTTLSHVTAPSVALREARRVLRPGGSLAIFDGDYASLSIAHPEPSLERRLTEALIATICANPTILRALPRLLYECGFETREALPFLLADVGTGTFFPNFAEAYAPLAARHGLVTAAEVETWLDWQRRAVEMGTFFASCNYYAYIARRP